MQEFTYDNSGLITSHKLDGAVLATPGYRPDSATFDPGVLETFTYANGTITYDKYSANRRHTQQPWRRPPVSPTQPCPSTADSLHRPIDEVAIYTSHTYTFDAAGAVLVGRNAQ